ncbi:hypothetical protein GGR51DRAFT_567479 [Nemania sp. FL0031]|nr:hypothetical protein GGR51DRAFT_567479 [Nemania sp. FL0031]
MAFDPDPSILEAHPDARLWGIPAEETLASQARSREIRRETDRRSSRVRKSPPVIDLRSPDQPRAKENRQSTSVGKERVEPAVKLPSISEWHTPPVQLPCIVEALQGVDLPSARGSTLPYLGSFPIGSRLPSISEWYPPSRHQNFGATVTAAEPSSLQSSLLNTPTRPSPTYQGIQPLRAPPYYHGEGRKRGRTLGDDHNDGGDGKLWDPAPRRKVSGKIALGFVGSDDDGGSYRPSVYDDQEERPRLPSRRKADESRSYTI